MNTQNFEGLSLLEYYIITITMIINLNFYSVNLLIKYLKDFIKFIRIIKISFVIFVIIIIIVIEYLMFMAFFQAKTNPNQLDQAHFQAM